LGVEPYVDPPYYVGYKVGDQEIGLDPNGHKQGITGPVGYYVVDSFSESLKSLTQAGAQMQQDLRDFGDGKLMATLMDADGNLIGLVQNP
jgi:predicted enzyme related to lactoylglutathione lyase